MGVVSATTGARTSQAIGARQRWEQRMSFVLKTLGAGVLFVLLAIGAAVADISLNNGRILFGMMGQDELTAACQPMLARAVAEKGVDSDTLVLGDVLRMNVSTDEGLVMERQISAAHE